MQLECNCYMQVLKNVNELPPPVLIFYAFYITITFIYPRNIKENIPVFRQTYYSDNAFVELLGITQGSFKENST